MVNSYCSQQLLASIPLSQKALFSAYHQVFYILSGTMSLQIEGTEYQAGPGTLVFFPAGVPHRNWNAGSERL